MRYVYSNLVDLPLWILFELLHSCYCCLHFAHWFPSMVGPSLRIDQLFTLFSHKHLKARLRNSKNSDLFNYRRPSVHPIPLL